MAAPPPRRLHVLTLGDAAAGKSCLVKRYCEGRFVARHIATIGIDYGVRRVAGAPPGGGDVRLNFFDASGLAAYGGVRRDFYRDAEVVRPPRAVVWREAARRITRAGARAHVTR